MPVPRAAGLPDFIELGGTAPLQFGQINLDQIDSRFEDGATVSPASILAAGLVKNRSALIKILGRGELTKKITVEAHRFSATARSGIEASGGKVVEVGS